MSSTLDTSTTGKHIPALDGIRGVAILMVLFCHLFAINPEYNQSLPGKVFAAWVNAGWIGVDLFFTLSGFLITGILYDTLGSRRYLRNFFARRSLRIFPLYHGFLLLMVVLSIAMGYRWHWPVWRFPTYTQNLLRHSGPYGGAPWVSFTPFWSLSIEEHFYLVWPFLLHLLRTKKRIFWIALVLSAASLGIRIWMQYTGRSTVDPYLPYEWTPARLDSLLLGAALAMIVRSKFRDRALAAGPYCVALGVLTALAYSMHAGGLTVVGDPWISTIGHTLIALFGCSLIGSALQHRGILQRALTFSAFPFFGRYSYGIYIFHFSVLRILQKVLRPLLLERLHSNAAAILALGLLTVALTVILAMLSFRFFESPILGLKRHFQDDSPTPKLQRRLRHPAESKGMNT